MQGLVWDGVHRGPELLLRDGGEMPKDAIPCSLWRDRGLIPGCSHRVVLRSCKEHRFLLLKAYRCILLK